MREELIQDHSNKKMKYKIGLVFYILYIICEVTIDLLNETYHDHFDYPFSSTYIYMSSMSLFFPIYLLVEFIRKKINQNDSKILIRNFYYFLNKKRTEETAINELDKFNSFTKDHFNQNLYRISIILMSINYIANVAKIFSMGAVKLKSENSTIVIVSLLVTTIVQKFFLNKSINKYVIIIGFLLNMIGLSMIFIFQFSDYFEEISFYDSLAASIISGVALSFQVCFLKLYHRSYGFNLNIFMVYGYVGLYCLIIIPLLLFFIILFFNIDYTFYDPSNIPIELLLIFLNSFMKNILTYYTIIYLSPMVFIIGSTFEIPLSIIWDYIHGDINTIIKPLFIIGSTLILISILFIAFTKYQKIKSDEYILLDEEN